MGALKQLDPNAGLSKHYEMMLMICTVYLSQSRHVHLDSKFKLL